MRWCWFVLPERYKYWVNKLKESFKSYDTWRRVGILIHVVRSLRTVACRQNEHGDDNSTRATPAFEGWYRCRRGILEKVAKDVWGLCACSKAAGSGPGKPNRSIRYVHRIWGIRDLRGSPIRGRKWAQIAGKVAQTFRREAERQLRTIEVQHS